MLTLCSYPFLFCLDRSNVENTIFILLAASVFLYKEGYFCWSAVFLGGVLALKPYGVVFLALPFLDRRFKETAIVLGTAALLTAGALLALPGTPLQNIATLRDSMVAYHTVDVVGNDGMFFGSSLFGLAKVWIYLTHFSHGVDYHAVLVFLNKFIHRYFRFALIAYGAVLVLVGGFRMEFWKKIALLVCCRMSARIIA
jgi:hypothetical protein